jgi:hypothetical protein
MFSTCFSLGAIHSVTMKALFVSVDGCPKLLSA